MATYTKLTPGSRGDQVRRLQTRLNAHGADLAVDGVFGSRTLDAVKKYQKQRGLAADGVVGEATWGRLLEGTASGLKAAADPSNVKAAASPAAATTAASGGSYRRTGVSDETAAALAELEKGYAPGASVLDAEAYLRSLADQKPGDYQSPYGADLDALLSEIRDRKPFSYDLNADLLYRQYRDQYVDLGRRAMADTMGRAAALTGGYGSTYSQSAGQQAYDNYLQQLNSKVPELYRLALEKYNAEGDALADEYGLLEGREADAYGRWRDAVGDWESTLAAARQRYEDERDFDYGAWSDRLKYWQDRSDDEYAAWWKQTQWDARQRQTGTAGETAAVASAFQPGRPTYETVPGVRQPLVHIPGYGEVTLSDARAMVAAGQLEWVMKDNRKDPVTDEDGNPVARMRNPGVTGPFRMVK